MEAREHRGERGARRVRSRWAGGKPSAGDIARARFVALADGRFQQCLRRLEHLRDFFSVPPPVMERQEQGSGSYSAVEEKSCAGESAPAAAWANAPAAALAHRSACGNQRQSLRRPGPKPGRDGEVFSPPVKERRQAADLTKS